MNIINISEIAQERKRINDNCIKLLQKALVSIIKLQIVSEDFLGDALPIGQLIQMEENVTRILEQAEGE